MPLIRRGASRGLHAPTNERHGDHWVISEVPEMLMNAVRRVIFSTIGTDITGVFNPQNGVFAFLWGLGGSRGIELNGLWHISGGCGSIEF